MSSTEPAPFYTSISNEQVYQSFHILANTCYILPFFFFLIALPVAVKSEFPFYL